MTGRRFCGNAPAERQSAHQETGRSPTFGAAERSCSEGSALRRVGCEHGRRRTLLAVPPQCPRTSAQPVRTTATSDQRGNYTPAASQQRAHRAGYGSSSSRSRGDGRHPYRVRGQVSKYARRDWTDYLAVRADALRPSTGAVRTVAGRWTKTRHRRVVVPCGRHA
jgi:hypothetical protein